MRFLSIVSTDSLKRAHAQLHDYPFYANSKNVVLVKYIVEASKVYSNFQLTLHESFPALHSKILHSKDSHTTAVTKYFDYVLHVHARMTCMI